MRWLLTLVAFAGLACGASAQAPITQVPLWNPAGFYVTVGQDEPGYRAWYMGTPQRGVQVKAFHDYLGTYAVAGVVPTWQLLRTASSWRRCGAQPFEVPPLEEWPNIVQTLRYIRDRVIPTIGPVEPVSAYRNPLLNICAGGASESAHRFMQAVDLVPLRPISREELMRQLCAVHNREGEPYGVGLGFYAYHRFHIDTRKFRNWGHAQAPEAEQCRRNTPPPAAPPPPATAPIAAVTTPQPEAQPAPDPLAPQPE